MITWGLAMTGASSVPGSRGQSATAAGAGGSTHVTGYRNPQAQLEQQLADWLGYPRALLFISGFAANQAVIAAMMEKRPYLRR